MSKLGEFKDYFDKHCAPRLQELRKPRYVYMIWTRGFVPNTTIETPVIRDSRVYLNKEIAEKAREQFTDKTYLVEYPFNELAPIEEGTK